MRFTAPPVWARFRVWLSALGVICLLPSVRPLGMNISTNAVVAQAGWPEGTVALANDPHRVGGYWINQTDSFFFAGDTAAFNDFLSRYAALSAAETPHVLTVSPGPGVTSRLGEKEPVIHYDWALEITRAGWDSEQLGRSDPKLDRFPVRVRITLATGGAVELMKIKPAANIELKTKSTPEIESWLRQELARRIEAGTSEKRPRP